MKILLVEKSPAIRDRLARMVRQLVPEGCLLEAEDMEQGLRLLAGAAPAVVILDFSHGGKGLRRLRQNFAHACIIANTYALPESMKGKVLDLGADAAFDKTIEAESLRRYLKGIVVHFQESRTSQSPEIIP